MFQVLGQFGCHFIVLCTILEDYLQKPIDFIEVYWTCISKGWLKKDNCYVNDALAILRCYTGKNWTRRKVDKLPAEIKSNEYTEVIYQNGINTHFTRRGIDSLFSSNTVKYGKIVGYYIYTVEE